MALTRYAQMAKDHWKEYRPKEYAELERTGKLTEAVQEADERTGNEMAALIERGMTLDEAWEMTREKYILKREEN